MLYYNQRFDSQYTPGDCQLIEQSQFTLTIDFTIKQFCMKMANKGKFCNKLNNLKQWSYFHSLNEFHIKFSFSFYKSAQISTYNVNNKADMLQYNHDELTQVMMKYS